MLRSLRDTIGASLWASPDAWAGRVVGVYRGHQADRVVAEGNQNAAFNAAIAVLFGIPLVATRKLFVS